jgi:hypothetical protein
MANDNAKTDGMNEAKFTQVKRTFSMVCRVEIHIRAGAKVVWSLLPDAKNFPRGDSTMTGIDGGFREGERLPGAKQTFKPRVSNVVPNERITWSDGFTSVSPGPRTYTLIPREDGSTDFVMEEHSSGLVFAMVKRRLPDFRPIFESYATDLKREAERLAGAP